MVSLVAILLSLSICIAFVVGNENELQLVCNRFFSLLAKDSLRSLTDFELSILIMSKQVSLLNSSIDIYAESSSVIGDSNITSFQFPNVRLILFDFRELLIKHEMEHSIDFFNYTDKRIQGSLRLDLISILLSLDTGATFIDMTVSQQQFLGNHIWNVVRCQVEASNTAYCLSKNILHYMKTHIKNRIVHNNLQKLEFGSLLFTKLLLNQFAITYYSMNHPEEYDINKVVGGIVNYKHNLLVFNSTFKNQFDSLELSFISKYLNVIFERIGKDIWTFNDTLLSNAFTTNVYVSQNINTEMS